jgi:prevent-host-death family protein
VAKQYSVAEARNRLPELVHDAEGGAAIEITRRGRPVAVLISVTRHRRLEQSSAPLWQAIEEFRSRADLEQLDLSGLFAGIRDRTAGRRVAW